jgi:hypothetical protein
VTERLAETVLVLPGGTLDPTAVDGICSLVELALRNAEAIEAALSGGMV